MEMEQATQEQRVHDEIEWMGYRDELTRYLSSRVFMRGFPRDEIDDIIQEILCVFYRKKQLARKDSSEVSISNPRAYLYAIAGNILKQWERQYRKGHVQTVSLESPLVDDECYTLKEMIVDPDATPEEVVLEGEWFQVMQTALSSTLSDKGCAIVQEIMEGRSHLSHIAKRWHISLNTVRYYQLRARKIILQAISHEADNEKVSVLPSSTAVKKSPPYGSSDLVKAIGLLPEPYRTVLTLSKIEGRKHSQIAVILQCPLGTVKGNLSRGLALLEELLHPSKKSNPRKSDFPELETLPDCYRQVLHLREVQGYTYKAIAEQLNMSVSCVKKKLYRARVASRAMLIPNQGLSKKMCRRRNIPMHHLERLHQTSYQHFYEVLSLAYVDGFSDREIAGILCLPIGTVKVHLTRGCRLLDRMSEEV